MEQALAISLPLDVSRLEAHADTVFERVSHYRGVGLSNHCRRVGAIAGRLLEQRGVAVRKPLLHALAMVHDHPLDAVGARMHRAHHDAPAPPIVKPPLATLGALFAGLAMSAAILGAARVAALWAGVLTGYLVYEISHLAAHLLDEAHHPWPAQRARHLFHHRSPRTCFGITSPVWDAVFGTLSSEERR